MRTSLHAAFALGVLSTLAVIGVGSLLGLAPVREAQAQNTSGEQCQWTYVIHVREFDQAFTKGYAEGFRYRGSLAMGPGSILILCK